tara:strand:+ start:925 stop:1317 length:393 start_codon:yes stop_codon:yes gene_type:complete
MTEQVFEWLITMRSALLVSAVCVLLYVLGKRMTMAFRKSETQVAFSLVDEFQSAIQNGMLIVSFHVPKGPPMYVEISVISAEGDMLNALQEGKMLPGHHTRSCEVGDWKGRCVLLLCSENQRLERFISFE